MICLPVMYTNKVLRPYHMFMLDNTFWVERLTGEKLSVEGWKRRQQMASRSCFSLRSSKLVIMAADSFWVILGSPPISPNVIPAETERLERGFRRGNEILAAGVGCHASRRFSRRLKFFGIIVQ